MKAPAYCLAIGLLLGAARAFGQEPAEEAPAAPVSPIALRYSIKAGLLGVDQPGTADDARTSATTLWRLRVEPSIRLSEAASVEVAFEQRLQATSGASRLLGGGVLPASTAAPFRLRQLDWSITSWSHGEWRGEIDRAQVRVRWPSATLTVGRQAIGWGRGVLFGAVDLFSPFSPLEADREWRRGVDAVRADVRLGANASLDVIAAGGERREQSALVAGFRVAAGRVDVQLVGGLRGRDGMGGVVTSAAVGDAEVHAEVALFDTPPVSGSTLFGRSRTVAKVVAGGSYRLPVGNGVLAYGEYHYSGFGAATGEQIPMALADAAFLDRYLRGDMQLVGRHAAAVLASYEWSPEYSMATQWMQSPVDGSGVVVLSVTRTANDKVSIAGFGYVGWGRRAAGGVPLSTFGGAPRAAFIQVRIYR